MQTRMNQNSLDAYEQFCERGKDSVIFRIYNYISDWTTQGEGSNFEQIAKALNLKTHTVVARLNELMYVYQRIRVAYVNDNKNYYVVRLPFEAINVRPKSVTEKLEQFIKEKRAECRMFVSLDEIEGILKP